MKEWIKRKKVKKLRNKLLTAREEQMHHRLMVQHCSELIHDIEDELDKLDAFHYDQKLITFDFAQKKQMVDAQPKIITAG